MTEEKRKLLKERVKLKALAAHVGCDYHYLSAIIHGRRTPSEKLAHKLAVASSYMTGSTYISTDFRA